MVSTDYSPCRYNRLRALPWSESHPFGWSHQYHKDNRRTIICRRIAPPLWQVSALVYWARFCPIGQAKHRQNNRRCLYLAWWIVDLDVTLQHWPSWVGSSAEILTGRTVSIGLVRNFNIVYRTLRCIMLYFNIVYQMLKFTTRDFNNMYQMLKSRKQDTYIVYQVSITRKYNINN